MADLDDDILALAGELSEDEAPAQTQAAPAEDTGSSPEPEKRKIRSQKRAKKAPRRRVARRNASSEDGDASPNSQNDSMPMEESDDEASSLSGDHSGALFPVENRFYSEKDKAEIMSKPEIEREEILAERAAHAERRQQNSSLLRMFDKQQEGADGAGKKRQADTAGIEGGERKSTRQRKNLGGRRVDEQSSAIAALKEGRAKLAERKAAASTGGRLRRSASGSDLDAEGESEVEWDDSRTKSDSKPQYEEPADLTDFNRLHVGRLQFAKYCYYPTFEKAVKDCYIRVAISGEKGADGLTYRMCKIEGIKQDGEPYALEQENGRLVRCQKYAIASIGKTRREWPFMYCSSSRFTEREFARYKSSLISEDISLPKKSLLISKIKDINDLIHYRFTEDELNAKLAASGVLEEREKKREKVILIGKRNDAEREGNRELMRQIDEAIRKLEGPSKLAHNTSLQKVTPEKTKKTEGQRLAELNRMNRKANAENVRRAELAELKAAQRQRAQIERGEAVADPFARVKIMPKTHFDVNRAIAGPKQPLTEAEIAKRIAQEKEREDTELARTTVPEGLAKLMNGEIEVQPGRIDFSRYDIMFQFGRLSQKKKPGQPSIFRRKLFDQEVLGSYDLKVNIDMDW